MTRLFLSLLAILLMATDVWAGTLSFTDGTSVNITGPTDLIIFYDQSADVDPVLGFDLLLKSSNTSVFEVGLATITLPFEEVVGANGNFAGLSPTGQTGNFQIGVISVTPIGAGSATLSFEYPTSQYGILLDGEFATNVISPTITVNVVPEPGTAVLTVIGLVSLLLWRRRRLNTTV